MRLRRPIAFILSAAVAASALTGCDSFSGHAAAAANSAQVQQLIEFIADLGLERDLRQALQKGGDLRQALLTLLGLESAVNFNVDDLAGARPGQHAVQVWEVTAQSAEDAAALAASQIRAVLEQLKSNGVTAGRIGMVEVDGKYYVVVDVEVTEENTFEPAKPVSDDDDDSDDNGGEEEQQPQEPKATFENNILTITGGSGTLNADTISKLLDLEDSNWRDSVTSIDLSDSGYTQIGNPGDRYGSGAFQGCDQLTKVTLPNTITEIGSYAFEYCTNLKEINLGDCTGLATIGDGAFDGCRGLTEINLGNCTGLATIGDGAFQSCTSLESITLPEGLTTIGDGAFAASGLTWIDLSNTQVTTILHDTFAGCHDLANVKLPKDLATIEGSGGIGSTYGAFEFCYGLTDITFYSVPDTIGTNAFAGVNESGLTVYYNPSTCNIEELKNQLEIGGLAEGTYTLDDTLNPAAYLLGF